MGKLALLDKAGMDKGIKSIQVTGAKLDMLIWQVGVSSLAHLAEFGDTGYVNRLYKAMPKGSRSSALVSWLLAYGGVIANTDKETKADKPFLFAKDKKTNVEGAMADAWYDHKPEKAPDEMFDLQVAMIALLKKATAAAQKGQLKGGAELLNKLREVAADAEAAALEKAQAEEQKGQQDPTFTALLNAASSITPATDETPAETPTDANTVPALM